MIKNIFFFTALIFCLEITAQPNCEVYKNDEACYESCQLSMRAIQYSQGSYQSQQYFVQSIERCESFAYAYMEKAVPYLKRGKFIEWKRLIDQAVTLDPEEYLGYRGWCRLQFLRDYEGAIKDIEQLEKLVSYDIGYCQTGDYHLKIALALCYKKLGNLEKAKQIFESVLAKADYSPGLYDYYHYGVLEYESKNYQQAITYLKKQIEINDYLGETYYFLAKAYQALGQSDLYTQYLKTAEDYYRQGKIRTDPYAEMIDKIYLVDILGEEE